jgi:hypothetical protein
MQRVDTKSPKCRERLAFEIYLRTGKIATFQTSEELQVKFNPWHDPDDGRFTFAGQGRYYGRGDSAGRHHTTTSGQSRRAPIAASPASSVGRRSDIFTPGGADGFGGGGASGSWSGTSDRNRSAPKSGKPTVTNNSSTPPPRLPARKIPSSPFPVAGKPASIRITSNGYNFHVSSETGHRRRTERVSGELRLGQVSQRSRQEQSRAGGADRKPTDDGGHFVAARFDGPRKWFNHFAQNSNFNRGAYRAIEDGWAKDLKAGKRVFVDIVPHYTGQSTRPDNLTIQWTVGDREYVRELPNKRKDK